MTIADPIDNHHNRENNPPPLPGKPFTSPKPCKACSGTRAYIIERNGQDTAWCAVCRVYIYNAPRRDTGRPQRSMRTRPDIKPSQKRRIFERHNNMCWRCNRDDVPLHIGHIISWDDGIRVGMTREELMDDENLVVMCEECNAGQASETLPARFMVKITRVRMSRRRSEAS